MNASKAVVSSAASQAFRFAFTTHRCFARQRHVDALSHQLHTFQLLLDGERRCRGQLQERAQTHFTPLQLGLHSAAAFHSHVTL
jgi:hypothetical protein